MKITAAVSVTLCFAALIVVAILWKSHFNGSFPGEYHKDVPINSQKSDPDNWINEKSDAGAVEDLLVELQDKADRYVVMVHTPNLEISDIDVKVVDKQLIIFFKISNGGNLTSIGNKDLKYLSRYMGQFSKTISLPGTVAIERIISDFKNDVLTVSLPKKPA